MLGIQTPKKPVSIEKTFCIGILHIPSHPLSETCTEQEKAHTCSNPLENIGKPKCPENLPVPLQPPEYHRSRPIISGRSFFLDTLAFQVYINNMCIKKISIYIIIYIHMFHICLTWSKASIRSSCVRLLQF